MRTRPFSFLVVLLVSVGLACNVPTGTPAVIVITATSQPSSIPAITVVAPTNIPPITVVAPTDKPQDMPIVPTDPPVVPTTDSSQPFFTEEFDNGADDWTYFLTNGDDSGLDLYTDHGLLSFDINGRNVWSYLLYNPYVYSDVRIDVSTANRGNNDNNISLICRYDENKGWYEFNVHSDGLYDILYGRWKSGQSGASYQPLYNGGSNAVHTGMVENEYTIICNGNTLALYINGTKVRSVSSEFGLVTGQIGIGVSSFDRYPVAVDFDWVAISEP